MMFDNIIGQKNTIQTLRTELDEGILPPAILFFGPSLTGKLSTALELARVLTCEKSTAKWGCSCHSCALNRLLLHPDLLLLGYRDFSVEIAASAQAFQQTKSSASKFLFIRSVRKLLKRFDPLLWDVNNNKIKNNKSSLQEIEDFMDILSEQKDFTDHFPGERLKSIVLLCQKISGDFKTKNIPIDHIRKAVYWAHISTSEANKIIIIENADKMLDSSRNSLLKVLEEPPNNVYIILLTSRKGAIIKTILSRLRPYHFVERTKEDTQVILNKIFKNDNKEVLTLNEYFLTWENCNPVLIKSLALKYIELVLSDNVQEPDIIEEMSELFDSGSVKTSFHSFTKELTHIFSKVLHKMHFEHVGFDQIEKWAYLLRNTLNDYELYNLNPKNILESLYYKMKAVI